MSRYPLSRPAALLLAGLMIFSPWQAVASTGTAKGPRHAGAGAGLNAGAGAPAPATTGTERTLDAPLPVRRVILYKHGVAYIERSGPVDGRQDILLEFKASQMNDVLKSLTLLDRSGGHVSGVSYENSDPLSRQLDKFAFSLPKEASLGQVLDQFKGARLVVKTAQGGELRGSILGVHRAHLSSGEVEIATLLLEGGELRNVALTEATELRLEDPRLQRDLASYLETLAAGNRRDLRALRIHPATSRLAPFAATTAGAHGTHELSVSYVVESPVWKTSYRLVADARPGEALLQGWAIVDNTTGEDWRGIELSLVAGLPISFTQNLYEPHYMKRPNVLLPFELALGPVLHEGALSELKDERAGGRDAEMDRLRSLQAGMAAKSMAVGGAPYSREASNAAAPALPVAERLERTVAAAAQGRALGELFEYRLEKSVDVPSSQSAMIPFVQALVKAERVLLYDPAGQPEHPYDALLVTNSSGKTLDGGAITVLEGDRYLGEGLIETLKAGDSRPVSFAVDLGTRVSTAFESRQDQIYAIKVRHGVITTSAKNVEMKTYTVRNTDAKPKTLVIEHPVRPGWKLAAALKPDETTAQHYRFRLALPPQQTAKLAVNEESEISNSIALTNLTPDLIATFVRNQALTPQAQKQLEAILALKDRIAGSQKKVTAQQDGINELYRDQERLRQNVYNLRGLPGQEAQVARYASKMAEQEKVLEGLQAGLSGERQRQRLLQEELDRTMATLEI